MTYFEETIGEFVTSLIEAMDVPVALSEEETGEYPYVTYENDVTPKYTKDGIATYRSATTLRVISNDFDEAESIADQIMEVFSSVPVTGYAVQFDRRERDRSAGVWTISLYYIIMQY